MKKLLAFILILALLLPAAALAAEPDPIVGCWYAVFDSKTLPKEAQEELAKNIWLQGAKLEVHFYWFRTSGEIYYTVSTFGSIRSETQGFNIAGTWQKNQEGQYTVVLNSQVSQPTFEDDKMFVMLYPKTFFALRKMENFDYETDLQRKKK